MKIFHAGSPVENLVRLQEIAKCFGIKADFINVEARPSLLTALREEIAQGCLGVVLDITSLKGYFDEPGQLGGTAKFLGDCDTAMLLLAMDRDESSNRALRSLTEGDVCEVNELSTAETVAFPESGSSLSRELSSHAFPREAKRALTLTMTKTSESIQIMQLNGFPAFVRRRLGRARVFVWSTTHVFDIRRRLRTEREFEIACDEYIPTVVFLRYAFGDQCWHNPNVGAGIVIDDPLLREKYGFLNFRKLLESAREHRYHVTLAFIPWNHWRSRKKDTRLFLDHSDCFSICAHGCDHTNDEYGLTDYDVLLRKNFVARERMDHHGRRTGLQSEPLMVCPQEKYSLEAMNAFSGSRQFLGLVCTACMPRNLISPQLCGADLLQPAQDSFFGFSVFKRHYWGKMAAFAMAMFLGKPAILVEHHEFFRDGTVGAEEFVRRVRELRPDLKWRSLVDTITRTHARRRASDGTNEVHFFTDRFILEHRLVEPTKYRLFRRVPEASTVERVLIEDKQVPFSRQNDFVVFETHLHRPDSVSVQVEVAPAIPSKGYPNGIKYQASVALRRGLSELRDNVISRNRFALKTGRFLMKSLERAVGNRKKSAHRG